MSAIDCMVIVAHMDDEALSTGGLILRRIQEGRKVFVQTMFGRKYNYGQGEQHELEQQQAFRKSLDALGVKDYGFELLDEGEPSSQSYYRVLRVLEKRLEQHMPLEVVIHDDQDRNQDHRWLSDVCKIALRPWVNNPWLKRVLMCQSPDGMPKLSNYYVPMTAQVEAKKRFAVECYEREARVGSHPRSPENLAAWHRVCGSFCGSSAAEPYRLYYQRD